MGTECYKQSMIFVIVDNKATLSSALIPVGLGPILFFLLVFLGLGIAMFNSLKNHTAGQMSNLPQTLSDASSLAGMNAQFGEQRDSCSFFNEILGILSGAFDGTMDFIDGVFNKLGSLLNQTGVSGVGRTASGISMLMSAANGSIRTVVKNVDDYLIRPMGKAFFAFNMQFDFDEEIKGDLEVNASGTESLMANEVRSQRLMQFLQVAQNPVLAPFAKMDYIIREIAKSMDLDPDKVTNSMGDAAIQAEILKGFQAPAPQPAGPEGQGVQGVADTTGGGGSQIGIGTAPLPEEQGFTGNAPQAVGQ